jgi:hypothetical protein
MILFDNCLINAKKNHVNPTYESSPLSWRKNDKSKSIKYEAENIILNKTLSVCGDLYLNHIYGLTDYKFFIN